jgi:hypothetical protein
MKAPPFARDKRTRIFIFLFLGAFLCPQGRAKKTGFPLQVLGFAYANPVGFPLQSLARRQLRTSSLNCLWQLVARNPAVANLFPQNCVVCHQS